MASVEQAVVQEGRTSSHPNPYPAAPVAVKHPGQLEVLLVIVQRGHAGCCWERAGVEGLAHLPNTLRAVADCGQRRHLHPSNSRAGVQQEGSR